MNALICIPIRHIFPETYHPYWPTSEESCELLRPKKDKSIYDADHAEMGHDEVFEVQGAFQTHVAI